MKRHIDKIILHCSDSNFGNSNLIREWHVKGNGWDDIGYQYVILNGQIDSKNYMECLDGSIECGRSEDVQGAHCRGENQHSIGICLIGISKFTIKQNESLNRLLIELMNKHGLGVNDIVGHYETNSGKLNGKTCPNIQMPFIRGSLRIFH